jgi:hypothetical protein
MSTGFKQVHWKQKACDPSPQKVRKNEIVLKAHLCVCAGLRVDMNPHAVHRNYHNDEHYKSNCNKHCHYYESLSCFLVHFDVLVHMVNCHSRRKRSIVCASSCPQACCPGAWHSLLQCPGFSLQTRPAMGTNCVALPTPWCTRNPSLLQTSIGLCVVYIIRASIDWQTLHWQTLHCNPGNRQ